MNVSCPECRSVFRVDPSKVPAGSVRARCSVCGGVITITGGTDARTEFAAEPAMAAASSGSFPTATRAAAMPETPARPPSPLAAPPMPVAAAPMKPFAVQVTSEKSCP